MGYLDTLIADVLGSERKRLIFRGLETQAGVVMSDSERWLEIEQCNNRTVDFFLERFRVLRF